jgi:hypothetical protein
LTVKPLDTGAKTYLAAVGAAAIYVSVDNNYPASVGATLDLDKALGHIQRIISPTVEIVWVAWSSSFVELAKIAQTPDIRLEQRQDGVKVPLSTPELVVRIENMARSAGTKLSPHESVLNRAQLYAHHLDETLAAMQQSGTLAEFNQAYKAHRLELVERGEAVQPYWAVFEDLRAVIIRTLIQNDCSSLLALTEIRAQFPWFTRTRLTNR